MTYSGFIPSWSLMPALSRDLCNAPVCPMIEITVIGNTPKAFLGAIARLERLKVNSRLATLLAGQASGLPEAYLSNSQFALLPRSFSSLTLVLYLSTRGEALICYEFPSLLQFSPMRILSSGSLNYYFFIDLILLAFGFAGMC